MERHKGQVVCLLSNHLSKQLLWKKCLQGNSLTSSFDSNLHRQTQQHSTIALFAMLDLLWHKDLYSVIDTLLSLEGEISWWSSAYSSCWSIFAESVSGVAVMDLNMLFNKATDCTVFITSIGSTPSAALGKFERPMNLILKLKHNWYIEIIIIIEELIYLYMQWKPLNIITQHTYIKTSMTKNRVTWSDWYIVHIIVIDSHILANYQKI